jgi:AAA domain
MSHNSTARQPGKYIQPPLMMPVSGDNGKDNGTRGHYSPAAFLADDLSTEFTDWSRAWDEQPAQTQWLAEPLVEKGTLVAIWSAPGLGKSLISLEVAARLARDGTHILYCDNENRRTDHVARLKSMGYRPGQLKTLHMLSFSSLPMLDTEAGGRALLTTASNASAALVIIDTISKFAEGEENSNDTFIQMYRRSFVPLKGAGIAVLQLDHPGKDASKGRRGGSEKLGPVDQEWQLVKPCAAERKLVRTKCRQDHGVTEIRLTVRSEPFGHDWSFDRSAGVTGGLDILRRAGVTADDSVRVTAGKVREAGFKMTQAVISDNLRKLKAEGVLRNPRNTRVTPVTGPQSRVLRRYAPYKGVTRNAWTD